MTAQATTISDEAVAKAATGASLRTRTSNQVTHIRPIRGLFDLQLDAVWQYRGLLGTLVKRDVMVLYRQAALGAAWAVVQPIFAVIIFTIVFGMVAKLPTPDGVPYTVFAFAAIVPWNYFAESVRRGSTSLVNESDLVKKVYFPRLIMPLAGTIAPLVDFAISFCVLMVVVMAHGIMPSWNLLAVPPLIVIAGLTAFSVSMWLGPINVRYRDVKHTLTFLLQIWMYASPVVYSYQMIPDDWKWAYALNPMVGVIEGFRWAVFGQGHPDFLAMGVGGGLTLIVLLGGLVFFKRMERSFADLI